ncbi:aminoimidazole riboside kinase [Superficieibacter sp. 1612_C1]|uniref:aminoimidazole riboside kinase n=1 Tax=Superficieibacter sp. 1612_C1 TaxID=2780382 RepID=UPI0018848DBA|nr:aminoimidazole riboside kinase [Superficieibacter sp. 1612_C1]
MNKIWVIGDASVDLVPETQNSYLKCPGGASANVAVCVARLGGACGFIGCLGDDDAGRFLRQVFEDNGVDVAFLRLDAALTSAVLIVNLADNGERSFTYLVHPGADTYVSPQDLPPFCKNQWFYFSSIGLTDHPAREACLEGARRMREAGGHVLFDVNLRTTMWRDSSEIPALIAQSAALASICKVSADELCQLSGANRWQDARYFLRELGCETTIISLGDDGALLISPEGEYRFPAPHVEVVDTTGAGDAFVGGLLFTLSQADRWDHALLAEAIGTANACGAMAVTAKGAMTALPFPDQLNTFLSSSSLAQVNTMK